MFIVNVEGAICVETTWLLIRRNRQESHAGETLSLVGGKVDKEGHSLDILERTVRRELAEEVSVNVLDPVTFVYSSSFTMDEVMNHPDAPPWTRESIRRAAMQLEER